MERRSRRSFLRTGGALAAALGVGRLPSRAGANSSERFIVDAGDAGESALSRAGLELVRAIEPLDLLVVRGAESDLRRVTSAYERDLWVPSEALERRRFPDLGARRSELAAGTAERAARQSALYEIQWDKRVQRIAGVHGITRGGGARVAVVDSGVQADHPDLQGRVNLALSRNFTDDGYGTGAAYGGDHGTVCAGVVAANGTYLLGSAPDVELVDCRVFAADGGGAYTADFLAAIAYAARIGCDVVNLSLGPGISTPLRNVMLSRIDSSRVLEYARERDTLVVIAAGNDAIDLHRYPTFRFPDARNAMIVSATGPIGFGWPTIDRNDDGRFDDLDEMEAPLRLEAPFHELAAYSNYGPGVIDIGAPGGNYDSVAAATDSPPGWFLDMLPIDVVNVDLDPATGEFDFESGWDWNVGTSFAAPQVAAAGALVRSVDPSLSAADVQEVLKRTATRVGDAPDPYLGAGFLDPLSALRAL